MRPSCYTSVERSLVRATLSWDMVCVASRCRSGSPAEAAETKALVLTLELKVQVAEDTTGQKQRSHCRPGPFLRAIQPQRLQGEADSDALPRAHPDQTDATTAHLLSFVPALHSTPQGESWNAQPSQSMECRGEFASRTAPVVHGSEHGHTLPPQQLRLCHS